MTRCPEGHFYDPAKHATCPWCALPTDSGAPENKTRPIQSPPPLPGASPAAPPAPAASAPAAAAHPNATVRVGASAKTGLKHEPVVGWLVCLKGPDRGRDYRLRPEKNFIGRAPNMDIAIEGDNMISRERHAIVIFDPKKKSFWALPGDASGLVYLNGEMVNAPTAMKADDVLELGQTKLVLIPFCGERYGWTDSEPAITAAED
jgi:hypothetical protein